MWNAESPRTTSREMLIASTPDFWCLQERQLVLHELKLQNCLPHAWKKLRTCPFHLRSLILHKNFCHRTAYRSAFNVYRIDNLPCTGIAAAFQCQFFEMQIFATDRDSLTPVLTSLQCRKTIKSYAWNSQQSSTSKVKGQVVDYTHSIITHERLHDDGRPCLTQLCL